MKVLYVGYYDKLRDGKKVRNYALSAAKKMDFIASAITEMGHSAEIVSPAYYSISDPVHCKESREHLANNIDLVLTPSWGAKNKLSRIARVLVSKTWLFVYLMRNTRHASPVLVYHNYELSLPVLFAHAFRRFDLILEIEEQYSKVWHLTGYQRFKENLMLKHGKKRAIVVSELLAQKLAVEDPVIIYGSYSVYEGVIPDKSDRDHIQLVYTGEIETVRNSAFMALDVMTWLPSNYELKITGSIARGAEEKFYNRIQEVNAECGRKACEYLGVLDEEEYTRVLLNSDIALNLQQEGTFGDYLFPSKIMMYLGHDLPVVSTKGGSICHSAVAGLIKFPEDYKLESIAKAIQSIDQQKDFPGREMVKKLREEFCGKLNDIL